MITYSVSCIGARVFTVEAVLPVRERLHLRQVRVLLERHRHGDHDRVVQQLLQDVRQDDEARRDVGGVAGHRKTEDGAEAAESVHGWQEEEGRDQCGLFRF